MPKKNAMKGGRTQPPEPAPFDGVETEMGQRRTRRPRRQPDMRNLLPEQFVVPDEPMRPTIVRTDPMLPQRIVIPALPFPDLPDIPRVFLRRGGAKRPRAAGAGDEEEESGYSTPPANVPVQFATAPPPPPPPVARNLLSEFDDEADADPEFVSPPPSPASSVPTTPETQSRQVSYFDTPDLATPPQSRQVGDPDNQYYIEGSFPPQYRNYDSESDMEGGVRRPMEDHFFFPARDRDRRYDMVDYSRVVPHRGGFRMTTSF